MYIANTAVNVKANGIAEYMPRGLRRYFYKADLAGAYEIRLSPTRPVTLYFPNTRLYLSQKGNLTPSPVGAVRAMSADITEALEIATRSSLYSMDADMTNGFLTVEGGHRIGICGTAVMRDGRIAYVKDISSLSYRIAHEIKGVSDKIMDAVMQDGAVRNTLIISPPCAGKTTMLRDMVRNIANTGIRVSVVDERREIGAVHEGRTAFDLGGADVFTGAPKSEGMLMVLRAMSPEVIVTDELGGQGDIDAAERIINCGTKLIASVHGYDLEQLHKRREMRRLLTSFESFITLSRREGAGTVEAVTRL